MIFDNQGIQISDVSFWQAIIRDSSGRLLPPEQRKYIDFQKMKDFGMKAVVIKCGQYNFKDPVFDEHWVRAKAVGLPRASYWFCDYRLPGKTQAQTYWSFVKHDIGEGFLCADWEQGGWSNWNELYNFMNELQQLSGLSDDRIVLYCGYYWWMENRPSLQSQRNWFAKFPLWLPAYTDPKNVSFVKSMLEWGNSCIMWQWGTPVWGKAAGCWSEEMDANLLNGGDENFKKLFPSVPNIPDPIPDPTDLFPYEIKFKNKSYTIGG